MTNAGIVLVTGASRGIGKATAIAFANAGYDVVLNYRTELEKTEEVKKEIVKLGRNAWVAQADIRDEEQVIGLVQYIKDKIGSLDILVNNAGVNFFEDIASGSSENVWGIVSTVLVGKILLTKHAVPLLKESSQACVINITSRSGREKIIKRNAAYSAAQAGVVQLTRCAALEFAEYGIRVNAVSPGFIETDMTKAYWGDQMEGVANDQNLVGRMGLPEEVARAVVFLASPESSYINGAVLDVTGGSR
jgi:3-oxoacyl-[acyl-carrier protein] reductase